MATKNSFNSNLLFLLLAIIFILIMMIGTKIKTIEKTQINMDSVLVNTDAAKDSNSSHIK